MDTEEREARRAGPTPSAQIPILRKKSLLQSIQSVLSALILFYIQWPVQSSLGKISPLQIHLAPSHKEPSFRVFPPTVTLVQAHTLHKNRCHILYELYYPLRFYYFIPSNFAAQNSGNSPFLQTYPTRNRVVFYAFPQTASPAQIPTHRKIITKIYTNCIMFFVPTDLIIPASGGSALLRVHSAKL